MSKTKTRKLDRRRERRALNRHPETMKRIGHGARTRWRRFITAKMFRQRDA